MDWRAHVFVNQLGDSWRFREELTVSEQRELRWRMLANYYGFWVSKVLHVWICYKAFRVGMFAASTAEFLFWKRFAGLNLGVGASLYCVDQALRNQLFLYCEDLREHYGTELDELRVNFLQDKTCKRMEQISELERLVDSGKQVRPLLEHVTRR